jgi:hypothetical protein
MLAAGFIAYEQEDDTTKDLAEFTLANAIFAALVESHAAEQNSRYEALWLIVICLLLHLHLVVTLWTMRRRMLEI